MTDRTGLMGTAEVVELVVSRQRVLQLAQQDGFPEPVAVLRMGKVWRIEDVEAWAECGVRAARRPPAAGR